MEQTLPTTGVERGQTTTTTNVVFHFDFISPYSYLASQRLKAPAYTDLEVDCRPVVFGTMLSRLGVQGPGEIPARRRIGLQDVLLLAEHYAIPIEGPPTHPFNSIYALRSVCAVQDARLRLALTDRYFLAAWAEGRDLADPATVASLARDIGIEQDVEAIASNRDVRQRLKQNTRALLDAGGWGVPTFWVGDVALFGHERLDIAAALVRRQVEVDHGKLNRMLSRPQPGRVT